MSQLYQSMFGSTGRLNFLVLYCIQSALSLHIRHRLRLWLISRTTTVYKKENTERFVNEMSHNFYDLHKEVLCQ